jgi:hypothetical protein
LGKSFSLEIKSRDYLDKISILDGRKGVLIEGDIGDLIKLSLHEDKLLEIQGTNGILRIELSRINLFKVLEPDSYTKALTSGKVSDKKNE